MDATQQINETFSEEEEEEQEGEEKGGPERKQLATLKVFKNEHIPETEFPLYLGENVIGRDPAACSVLLPARSISSRHAVISISVFRSSNDRFGNSDDIEALLWDMGSLNGTRKGRLKLTSQVRYALNEGESVVLADVPCQYTGLKISKKDTHITPEKGGVSKKEKKLSPALSSSDSESESSKGVRNRLNVKERSVLPPVPLWSSEDEQPKVSSPQSAHKQPEITLVPESDSDGESAPDERNDFVSDSMSSSHLCSSTNSSFLTPAKKVIPESEDESSVTPSSASIDRFRLRQTPDEPCSKSTNPGPLVLNLDSDTDFKEKDMESKPQAEAQPELAAKMESVSSAEFHMDSDTDVEEEEPETSKAGPDAQEAVTLEKSLSSVGLHVDSDTDVEEEEPEISKAGPDAQEAVTLEKSLSSVGLHVDSDTDVEEEEPETSKAGQDAQEAVTLEKSLSSVGLHVDSDTDVEEEKNKTEAQIEAPNAGPASSADLHMDSDTDVEEEEEKNKTEPQIEQAPNTGPVSSADLHMDSDTDVEEEEQETSKADPQAHETVTLEKSVSSVGLHMDSDTDVEKDEEEKGETEPKVHTEEAPKVKSDLQMDSDTDVEENETSITENVSKKEAVKESPPSAAAAHAEFHMDSDTDVEDDDPMKVPFATDVSHPVVEVSDVRPTSATGTELHMDCDTGVDEEENGDKEKLKAKGLQSNSETDDEDPFKPKPGKAEKDEQNHKISVGSKEEQSEESTHKKQDHHSQAKTNFEEPTQAFGHFEEDWDLLPTQAYGAAGTNARLKPKQLDLEATQAYGTETEREEEQEALNHTQPYSNLSSANTQLIPEAKPDDDKEDKETQNDSHLSTADTLIIASTPKREEQTQLFSLFTAQTQLIWEGEDKEVYQNEPTQLMTNTIEETEEAEEENIKRGMRSLGGGTVHKGKNTSSSFIIAETQPICEEEAATVADLSGVEFQKPSARQHTEKYDSAPLAENNLSSYLSIAETQPMCDDDNAPDQDKVVSSSPKEKPSSYHIAIAETQPMFEEDEAPEDDPNNEVSRRQTEGEPVHHNEKASTSNRAIPETQFVGEDNDEQEEEPGSKMSIRRSHRCRSKKEKEVPQPAEAVVVHTIEETQPMCEEEQTDGLKSLASSGRQQAHEFKSPETDLKACVSVAETQPMCEEETPFEDLINAASTRQIDEDRSTDLLVPLSSHVTIDETQPMHEEDEGWEKDLGSKMASGRSHRGRPKKDDEVTQTAEAAETKPVPEVVITGDEDLNSGVKSRRSRRGRPVKEDRVPQPAEVTGSSISIKTETKPVHEDRTERDEGLSEIKSRRHKDESAQSAEANSDLSVVETQPMVEENVQERPSGRSSRRQRKNKTEVEKENTQEEPSGRSSRRQRKDETVVESETAASSKVQGKTRKGQEGKRKRGKVLSEDEVESEEEKNMRRVTRQTGIKLKCSEKEEEENPQEEKEKMEKGLQEREEKERLEMEEKERLEYERKKQEEYEQRKQAETKMSQKLEREQKELEKKERLKREEEEEMRKENERIQLEKEEKDRLEKEKREMRESRELEEKRQKEEEERIQKEMERLEAEKLEKERLENEELQMRAREQKKTKERNLKKQKNEEYKTELEVPLVPSARRASRYSNSSMNSDQSVSSQPEVSSQRGRGRGRGRGKQTAGEQPISARQSSRRGAVVVVEDKEQDCNSTTRSRSRSSSRSSERSSHSVGPSNQGTRGRGRKSMKLPEPEEVSQAKTSGKGRGRGGRRSGAQNVNVRMDNENEQAAKVDEDNTAIPQTNSRGRKRAANTSASPEETPSPTPKTARRSVASQAHKVLFTGLTDEDGERVVSRLGGSLAKGVNDMTHLVTDKARRTVKFLCAVARGVPIVTPDWLKKCGKAGHFLSTDEYILKDTEQEKKFCFSLQASLQTAQTQPLLKGYEIHVTPSVMPEPSQMKEIITCCGARFLPKMPSAHKEHTVVVSCEQDRALCVKAVGMSLPVVSTEFLLTGILQQRVDLQAFSLTSSLNTSNQPAAPKAAARGRRKQ